MTTVELKPAQLGNYLTLAMAQRSRQMNTLSKQLGADSAAVAEIKLEITQINAAITECVKQAASAPHSSKNK